MAVHPKSFTAGKCYITREGQLRRIIEIIGDDNVNYEVRSTERPDEWRPGPPLSSRLTRVDFVKEVDREVQCSHEL